MPDGVLPPGIYFATWQEVQHRFGTTEHRRRLLAGLRTVLVELIAAGCRVVYLDGSFVTSKELPGDYDLCWDGEGVRVEDLSEPLQRPLALQEEARHIYLGHVFPADFQFSFTGWTVLQHFQMHRPTLDFKGIVTIDVRTI